jgi:hypothetical protein
MGYDVHVVLTAEWVDAASRPITHVAVDKLIADDKTLAWSSSDFVEMTEPDGSTKRYFMIQWNGVPTFWWYRTEILCKNPSEEQLLKLVEMATVLGARVLGDDGEQYQAKRSFLGKPKLVIVRR